MQNSKLASRYSKSLLDLSIDKGVVEIIYNDIVNISDVLSNSAELKMLMRSPIIEKSKKSAILSIVFPSLHKLTQQFIGLLLENNRENELYMITKEFRRLYGLFKGAQEVSVISANTLDKALVEKIIKLTSEYTQSKIVLKESVNPQLIGGFLLRIGDLQYDATVLTKIRKLQLNLAS